MKLIKFLFFKTETKILLIFLVLLLNSCSNNKIKINSLLRTWQVDYIELNGKNVKHLQPSDEEFEYEFKSDKTYLIYLQNRKDKGVGFGKWELNNADNSVYLKNEKNEIYSKIITVTDSKMILVPVSKIEDGSESLVKYHYVFK